MFKKLVLIAVVLIALLATASPALAASGTYYVDTAYTGTEVGTAAQPFNTLNEAIAAAQANPVWRLCLYRDGRWYLDVLRVHSGC